MKKTFKLLSAIVLLLFCIRAVSAEETKITLSELDMSFSAPSGWTVLTRDVSEDEQYLSITEVSRDELINYFKQNNIYAELISESGMKEFFVTMFSDNNSKSIYNMNHLKEQQLKDYQNKLPGKGKDNLGDAKYNGNTILKLGDLTYIVSDITVNSGDATYPRIQYYTIYNGKYINILFDAYDKTITEADKTMITNLIQSISVTVKEKPEVSLIRTFLGTFSWAFFSFAAVAVLIALLLIFTIKKKKAKNTGTVTTDIPPQSIIPNEYAPKEETGDDSAGISKDSDTK